MNNLQIALDPSCIQIRNEVGEYEMQISVVLTGLSFDDIIDKEFKAAKYLLGNYFDYSALRFDKIKLYFLNEKSEVIPEDITMEIVNPIVLDIMEITPNVDALNILKDYIREEIDSTVDEVKERMIYKFKADESITTIEITDDNFDQSGEKYENAGRGYSNMAFANFSQLLSPLNEQAGLVLFTKPKKIKVPSGEKIKFLAFPYRDIEPGKPEQISEENTLWKSIGNNLDSKNEDGTTATFGTHYICMETAIPKEIMGEVDGLVKKIALKKGKIILRDENGNFDGRVDFDRSVDIDVVQELDWIRDYYAKIASYFDFPRLLQEFYAQPNSIKLLINEYQNDDKVLKNLESDMWRLILDPFIIHDKKLPSGNMYLDSPVINDVDRKVKDWFENFFLKFKPNIQNIVNKLKILLLSQETLKESYTEFWEIENNNVKFVLPDKIISQKLILDWMNVWSKILEASRQFHINKEIDETESEYENKKASLIGIRLIDAIVDFFNEYNTSYTGTKLKLIDTLIDPIQKYNESVYYYFFLESKKLKDKLNIKDFIDNLAQDNKLPQFWDKYINLPSIFDTFHSIALSNFKIFLNDSLKEIKDDIKKTKKLIFDPPPIQIKVHPDSRIHNEEDDISDEIAGFVLLNQRSKNINDSVEFHDWNYLNITTAKINNQDLGLDFLKPLFLPEIDGMPLLSLSLSNQKRSLVESEINIQNSNLSEVKTSKPPYEVNNESHEFWYGYHYNFAGFVVLNSGALPPIIREGKINNFKKVIDFTGTNAIIKPYHHLRKVVIGAPNISPEIDPVTKQFIHKSPPSDFNPLAKELSFWREKEHKHFILSKSPNFNNKIVFNVAKANTSFWDWFAFENKTIETCINYSGDDQLLKSVKTFLEKKEGDNSKNELNIPDPAVFNRILVEWWLEFPIWETKKELTLDSGTKLTVKWDDEQTDRPLNNIITVKKGEIVNIKFSTLVEKTLFDGTTQRIDCSLIPEDSYGDYYKFAPITYCFEAAKHPTDEIDTLKDKIIESKGPEREDLIKKLDKLVNKLETDLWELIEINDNKIENTHLNDDTSIKVFSKGKPFTIKETYDIKNEISPEFAYVSELQIRHQRWYWDGRLDVSNAHLNSSKSLDPKFPDYKTTPAMQWEAWSFSNRPDHTGTVLASSLKTFKSSKSDELDPTKKLFFGLNEQLLLTIQTKEENKALYNRFAVRAYSRYRFLDKYLTKHSPIEGKVFIIDNKNEQNKVKNQWKRFIQLSNREETLPTPVVRFFIPLTESINTEAKKQGFKNAAPIMVVVEGNVFNEAGFAYGLEIGIEKVNFEGKNDDGVDINETLLKFGTNPTYSKEGSKPIQNVSNDPDYFTFEPIGPLGFTFDIGAENPKVTSSAYLIDLSEKNLNDAVMTLNDHHQAWSLMRIAVRSVIRNRFYKNESDISNLRSKWSEKTWVEFSQAIDSFIPTSWIEKVNQNGFVEINHTNFTNLPNFDKVYEDYVERYIIVTKIESDIGGMPVESYYGTFYYDKKNTEIRNIDEKPVVLEDKLQGYIRILIVHKNNNSVFKENDVWGQLFGQENSEIKGSDKIKNDATIARPLITKRVPVKFKI